MNLLPKQEVKSKIQKQNDELLILNARLRKTHSELIAKINNTKTNYSKDSKVKEFEEFCADILQKKGVLLKELQEIINEIDRKKEIIYGLVEKQDELMEREYEVKEREIKLSLREDFIKTIEEKSYGR